jgi:hypothetical protein
VGGVLQSANYPNRKQRGFSKQRRLRIGVEFVCRRQLSGDGLMTQPLLFGSTSQSIFSKFEIHKTLSEITLSLSLNDFNTSHNFISNLELVWIPCQSHHNVATIYARSPHFEVDEESCAPSAAVVMVFAAKPIGLPVAVVDQTNL